MTGVAPPAGAPTLKDVEAAARRIEGEAVVTPLHESPALNARAGGRVLLKCENLQRTGSFKFRGAFNRISQIPEADRAKGVIAYSSGNHAQGVAAAAQLLGLPATIVMPADAPRIKVENTKGYGAEVVFYDRVGEDRAAIAAALQRESGATLIRPYDDFGIIAGQGTCGLEIVRQAEALGAALDLAMICCGGGGLTAGSATVLKALSPGTEIIVCEPAGFDETARSLASGRREENARAATSICDALMSKMGEITFPINQQLVSHGLAASDEEVLAAMAYAFNTLKLVVEPGGAVCLAALLAGKLQLSGRTVAVTLSGGNVDPAMTARALGLSSTEAAN